MIVGTHPRPREISHIGASHDEPRLVAAANAQGLGREGLESKKEREMWR